MIIKKHDPSIRRSSEAKHWGELDQLCKKTSFWLYTRKQKAKAEQYAERLEEVLREIPDNHLAIVRAEGLALLGELRGDLDEAIAHRRREIRLMEKLHREAESPSYAASTRAYMLRGRNKADLRERRAILGRLIKTNAGHRHEFTRKAQ
jgi:hypothetical protein